MKKIRIKTIHLEVTEDARTKSEKVKLVFTGENGKRYIPMAPANEDTLDGAAPLDIAEDYSEKAESNDPRNGEREAKAPDRAEVSQKRGQRDFPKGEE